VRGHLDEADDRIKEGEPAIARLEGVQKECTSLEARRATLKTQLEQVHADQASREEQEATCSTLEAQLADEDYGHAERDRLRQAETELAQLGSIEVTTEELERVRGSIRSAEKRLLAERALQERRAQAGARLRQAEAAIQRLPEVEARLADVRRALEQKDYGHAERAASESVLAQIKALGYTRAAHEELKQATMEQQSWGEKHARLGNALATLDDLRHTLRVHRELASRTETDLARAEAEAQAHDAELRKRQAVEYNLQEGERRLAEAKTQHQMAHKELGRATQELARCDEFAEVLESYRAQHAALSQKHGVYDELALAFGKKGVQAMLIETAIPELEHEANRLLARMTDNQMHLSFETQRDSKKGDTIETLDIRIADTLGTRDYAMFSGGEAFRVNFAVRIALSKLLARRADANLKTLVIDEGFGTQDNHGRDRIVEAIEAVSRDFERIIVITHIQELKDMFPTQIEITKGAQGSSWRVV
jgi:DNA repair protein SbcC/Rad50